MRTQYEQLVARFRKAEEGSIAVTFGLVTLVLTLVAGLAIDSGRVYHAATKMTTALDAAALSAAKTMRVSHLTDDELKEVAKRYFEINIAGTGGNYAVIDDLDIAVNRDINSIALTLASHVPTVFGRLAGVDSIAVPVAATAIYQSQDIELALQLDVTGSMRGSRLADLKVAVKDLLDIVLPDEGTTNKVRVGLAPFSAGVNAGSYAAAVSDGRSRDGCVYERRNLADQASEAPAVGLRALKVREDLSGRSIQSCPSSAAIVPLSDDKDILRSTVEGYTDGGTTAGHLGTAWGWYLLSPEWAGIWPSSSEPARYNDGKTIKAVVVMTDGIYNTIGGINGGDHSSTADNAATMAVDTCTAMKAQGIRVYAIGFQAPSAALETLRSCASTDTSFFEATDGEKLRAAFRAIATELNNLRLSS
ncbi:MAG TPA: pilus assembly protein TadG-related protein [Hyphomicrobiaceae bacterium]|jgi:Flp pilus assembly protein TadG|nr:pilus assembly protein TadG-related protein [Hyphomicrobiaceae bacterium]